MHSQGSSFHPVLCVLGCCQSAASAGVQQPQSRIAPRLQHAYAP